MLRRILAVACLAVMSVSCSDATPSIADYTERVGVVVDEASDQYWMLVTNPEGAVLVAEPDQIRDFTPRDLHYGLEQVRQIEADVERSIAAIDPPDEIAEFHYRFFDFGEGFISAQEALATRAATATDWDELSESSEMAAYRIALARDKQQCFDFQTELNAISERRENLADATWIPGDLKEVFEAFLGCDGYPANPTEVYRPSPAAP